jgi:signal transduction histidine kinase
VGLLPETLAESVGRGSEPLAAGEPSCTVRDFPDAIAPETLHDRRIGALFSILARRRAVGVAVAMLVEVAVLVPLARADADSVVGIPGAVAAAIGGTVAVVLGPFAGALVAFVGGLVFAGLSGWGTGELALIVVWPAIVTVAGLFGRRVERQRQALARVVATHEEERQRLALTLHDETAQMLAASLMVLGDGGKTLPDSPANTSTGTSRTIIEDAIRHVRALAVDLRPKVLDDYGLAPALESLADGFTERTGVTVDLDLDLGDTRLPAAVELVAYRLVQTVLSHAEEIAPGATVRVAARRRSTALEIVIEHDHCDTSRETGDGWASDLEALRERVRLVGGRLTSRATPSGVTMRAEMPLARIG